MISLDLCQEHDMAISSQSAVYHLGFFFAALVVNFLASLSKSLFDWVDSIWRSLMFECHSLRNFPRICEDIFLVELQKTI
jgi:hypothetical protein